MRRIYVDFNSINRDPQGRIALGQEGTPNGDDLPPLLPGERVVFYDSELEVTGTVQFEMVHDRRFWLGVPDWSTMRDLVS